MTTKIFTTTDSELRKYDGQRVEVLRPLTEKEADLTEVGPMFKIRFADGYERDAFGDELTAGPYSCKVNFGSDRENYDGDYFEFESQKELNAFLAGVEAGEGWLESDVVEINGQQVGQN